MEQLHAMAVKQNYDILYNMEYICTHSKGRTQLDKVSISSPRGMGVRTDLILWYRLLFLVLHRLFYVPLNYWQQTSGVA